ncbi:tetratricopeptide repeat protein [Salipiger bermudensis]|uniref:tetratricopeptide repeat protein n=1 Tax=Salipiger TaxID=263377 RepID=UPI001CD66DBE|nr:tetratricopeptide repeat protein [Salipiger bermudensis]MCA0962130.1 tetratricopeptide repeat protein [Salipiger bermudensis]
MRQGLTACLTVLMLAACASGDRVLPEGQIYAPTLDPRGEAVDGLVVGHRLMQAGQYELALEAFTRAAASHGLTAEVLSSLGTANLGLGRLNQSEALLRQAVEEEPDWSEAWNNLGVVLMERGETAEASEVFRRAYALDNGESDAIRDNLRLALAKMDAASYGAPRQEDYKLVRRGSGSYLIRSID